MEAIYNPFVWLRGSFGLVVGLLVVVVLGLLSWAGGVHLDGALDLHYDPDHHPSAAFSAVESAVSWLSLAACFWLMGMLLGSRGSKATDYLAMTAIARWPYIPMALLCAKWGLGRYMARGFIPAQMATNPVVIGLLLLTLLCFIWAIVLLVFAFKEAAETSGWRTAVGVIGGLLAAEVLSKVGLGTYLALTMEA